MKSIRCLLLWLGLIVAISTSTAKAGLVVTGIESLTTPGLYTFTLSQDATVDAIQTKSILAMNFKITLPGLVLNTYTGSLTDNTVLFSPDLGGWGDLVGAASANPNLITSANSGPLTLMGTTGTDFSVTNVSWDFFSNEMLSGTVVQGVSPPGPVVPEPSSIVLLLTGGLGLCGYGWRRKKNRAA